MARAINAQPYLTLDRYRQLMNLPIDFFNGVDRGGTHSACDHCWSQWEREMVAMALADAMGTLKTWLKYPLGYEYLIDNDHPWTDPILLNYGHVIGGGIQGLTDVSAAVTASDFTVDPATITIPSASFPGGTSEVLIVETLTGLQIVPDSITVNGANYDIEIDQCKLIEWDNLEDATGGDECITYDAAFPAATWLKLADLTIYREYLDTSSQATIKFASTCNCTWCGTACAGDSYSGCVYVLKENISKVRVQIADYDETSESWSCGYPTLYGCYHGSAADVYYKAGTVDVPGWEQAVIRLAHTYMLVEPCGCALYDAVWNRDNAIPSPLTAERVNCPLGTKEGAWYAWQWLQNHMQGRAYMMG